jgi:hypothetical protein
MPSTPGYVCKEKLVALEEQVRGKRARYSGYRSFQYLEAGVDYTEFQLAREVDRVASHKVDVSVDQEARVQKLLEECLVVSLHDHAVVVPERAAWSVSKPRRIRR